jgi:Ca2+/H+ antiporter, TMEM165/GDT1 family
MLHRIANSRGGCNGYLWVGPRQQKNEDAMLSATFSHLLSWSAASAVSAAFLASLVEVVEAFTIILAVGTVRGWRPALAGTAVGLMVLAAIVAIVGPALNRFPIEWLQLAVGILLLLFGMRWLRKAILRHAGVIPLHDETAAFAAETAELQAQASERRADWIAGVTAFKAVLLEGLEVVFIVLAVGAGRGLIGAAALGAAAAGVLVLAAGVLLHRPLARVPENALKFGVGVLLSAFGVFWTGEGLGIAWPGQDLALAVFIAIFLAVGLVTAAALRHSDQEVLS